MSERTRRQAAIHRATRAAQQRMNRLDRQALEELEAVYRRARDRIEQRIREAANGDGIVGQEALARLRNRINGHLETLRQAQSGMLDDGLAQAAQLGTSALESELAGARLSAMAEDAVRQVRAFVDANGLQLSDRVWRLERNARESVTRAVESAVAQGSNASRAAREFLERGQPIPDDIARKIGAANAERLANQAGRALMVDNGNAYADARRVFRTELNRAHGLAYRNAALETEGAVGTRFLLSPRHPRRDICDMHAAVNRYGLGPGVYPPGRSPWPAHPNTLSYEEVVFDDEVTDEDREGKQDRLEWLRRQPPELQEAVLNSRRKRVALQKGLLSERQIATPWHTVKERLRRRGIDLDTLRPEPIEAQRWRREGNPISAEDAERYVIENGRAAGVEYALVRDLRGGHELFRKTSNQRAAVYFSGREVQAFADPSRRLELVHNHPGSRSLSGADLELGTRPGIARIVAVGHDGSRYSARSLADRQTIRAAERKAVSRVAGGLWPMVNAGLLSAQDADLVYAHLKNQALARAGHIRYELERASDALRGALEENREAFERIVRDAAEGL